jgi:monovalent cation/proton antiporter MnhG/PhaG subunit
MMTLLSAFFLVAGAAICLLAAVGVLRLPDFLMRMHAATKAGVAGCGLLLIGVAFGEPSASMWVKVTLAIIFLLLTTPVAGHLLARAGYVAGVPLWTGTREDQLQGTLRRGDFDRLPRTEPRQQLLPQQKTLTCLPQIRQIRFGVIRDQVAQVTSRASGLAEMLDIRPSAHVIIDELTVEAARDPSAARELIRGHALQALEQLDELASLAGRPIDIRDEEGDPEDLLAMAGAADVLLLMPSEGWFHHGADLATPNMSWESDGLLRLPGLHGGPVLFVGPDNIPADNQHVVIRDDGAAHIPEVTEWALKNGVWRAPNLHLVWQGDEQRHRQFAAMAAEYGAALALHLTKSVAQGEGNIPEHLAGADAIILGRTPRPLRARWYGYKWTDRISPGWKGEILIFEPARDETVSSERKQSRRDATVFEAHSPQVSGEVREERKDARALLGRSSRQDTNASNISEIVVALANGTHANATIDEAIALATVHGVPIIGLAIIDTKLLKDGLRLPIPGMSSPSGLRSNVLEKARRSLADTVQSFEERAQVAGVTFSLFMDENDPISTLRTRQGPQRLMLVGRESWFNHGIGECRANPQEYLVRRGIYPLISVAASPASVHTISFVHDGTPHSERTLQWFLATNPWPESRLRLLPDPAIKSKDMGSAYQIAAACMSMEEDRGDIFSHESSRPDVLIFGNEGHHGWINRAKANARSYYSDIPIVVFG